MKEPSLKFRRIRQLPGRDDRFRGEIHIGYMGAQARPAQRVQTDVALEVRKLQPANRATR